MTAAGRPIRGGCGSSWRRRASPCRSSRSILGARAQIGGLPAINPVQRVPALVLDDGTVITESIAICRYFEGVQPEPPLFGRGALEEALVEMWNAAHGAPSARPVSHVFRHTHPGDEGDGGAAGAGLGRGQQAAGRRSFSRARPRARRSALRRRRTLRSPTSPAMVRGRFHEAGEARGAGRTRQSPALARRGFGP